MLILKPATRYDMPAAFGPSTLPDISEYQDARTLAIPFLTEAEAVAPLLPRYFEVAAKPVITVSQQVLKGVDYLGGRGYNIVNVIVDAVYRGPRETIRAPYTLAVWETDTNAITAGRELLGTPKLYGCIPDMIEDSSGWSFSCSEYDGLLLSARATGMQPIEGEAFEKLKKSLSKTVNLGWKYIPGPGGTADVDYPVKFFQLLEFSAMWSGHGEVTWGRPSLCQSPISARIIERLRELPIVKYLPAFAARGTAHFPRAWAERLAWEAESESPDKQRAP